MTHNRQIFRQTSIISALFAIFAFAAPSFAQNVGVTDKTGGITPASQLQVHKETSATSTLIQMTNQATGETATDGVHTGIDNNQNAFITNQETGKTVYIGTAVNNTEIESDGTIKFNGNATVWDDLQTPASAAGAQGNNKPDWTSFRGTTLQTWAFANNLAAAEDELFFTLQLPHTWKEGSILEPHIHIAPSSAPATDQVVVWKLEYVWANVNTTYPVTTTTLTANVTVTPSDDHRHILASFGSITPDANTDNISSVLVCRLYRNSSDPLDTYSDHIFLISLDVHYEKDTEGSRSIYTKN